MATADELLNSLIMDDSTEPHIIVNPDRTIMIPDQLKKIAVQYDHDIETVTFDCPRYWDGHDMSAMVVYINYKTPDNQLGSYHAKNVMVDESDDTVMHFDWTLSRNVTHAKGNIAFLVCIRKTDEAGDEVNHWNSELNRELIISEGLECDEVVLGSHPDVITDILLRLSDVEAGKIILDTTLAVEGYAADAKAVGEAIDALPIEINESDGFTDIHGLRQATNVAVVQDDQAITVTTTLQGDINTVDVITFNNDGFPSTIVSNGSEIKLSWEGFTSVTETVETALDEINGEVV